MLKAFIFIDTRERNETADTKVISAITAVFMITHQGCFTAKGISQVAREPNPDRETMHGMLFGIGIQMFLTKPRF